MFSLGAKITLKITLSIYFHEFGHPQLISVSLLNNRLSHYHAFFLNEQLYNHCQNKFSLLEAKLIGLDRKRTHIPYTTEHRCELNQFQNKTNAQTQPTPSRTLRRLNHREIRSRCTAIDLQRGRCNAFVWRSIGACDRSAYAVAKPTCRRRKEFEKRIRVLFFSSARSGYVLLLRCRFVCFVFSFFFFSFRETKQKSLLISSLFAFVRRLLFIHWFSSHCAISYVFRPRFGCRAFENALCLCLLFDLCTFSRAHRT